jgi:hypothetical protein
MKQPFEHYLALIQNGAELYPIELSNAKKLVRKGCTDSLEKAKAIVLRNRVQKPFWNEWYYDRFSRRPEEEIE